CTWLLIKSSLSSFLSRYFIHRDVLSFPTRRSSDLTKNKSDNLLRNIIISEFIFTSLFNLIAFLSALLQIVLHTCRSTALLHPPGDRKSTRLNSSHVKISYAVICLKKKFAKKTWSKN